MEISKAKTLVQSIRFIMESPELQRLFPHMQNFPNGKCDYSSYILMAALRDEGYKNIYLATSESKKDPLISVSHTWVVWDGRIVDITADQFNDRLDESYKAPSVVITKYNKLHSDYFDEIVYSEKKLSDWCTKDVFGRPDKTLYKYIKQRPIEGLIF